MSYVSHTKTSTLHILRVAFTPRAPALGFLPPSSVIRRHPQWKVSACSSRLGCVSVFFLSAPLCRGVPFAGFCVCCLRGYMQLKQTGSIRLPDGLSAAAAKHTLTRRDTETHTLQLLHFNEFCPWHISFRHHFPLTHTHTFILTFWPCH